MLMLTQISANVGRNLSTPSPRDVSESERSVVSSPCKSVSGEESILIKGSLYKASSGAISAENLSRGWLNHGSAANESEKRQTTDYFT